MNSIIKAGQNKVTVELTADEALALTGVRFNNNPQVETIAKKKIRRAFEKTFDFSTQDKVDYELLK
ncbi:hypothetical protein [Paenibacillus gallinarum]|uniref:Uncharacterized protein n=1 Tax=Paenibacillus gallinarum TaxID=2762232 RepID=A0ABR8SU13_9BACL|nr:hypothetical protein [Paenibacillus gallinarum]MBD7966838.1 hypothetical protein [Paenibacillus gallinarum]